MFTREVEQLLNPQVDNKSISLVLDLSLLLAPLILPSYHSCMLQPHPILPFWTHGHHDHHDMVDHATLVTAVMLLATHYSWF